MKLLVPSDSFVMPSFLPKSVMENVQTCVLPSDDNAFLVEPDININSSNSVLLDDGYSSVFYDGNSQLNSTFDVQYTDFGINFGLSDVSFIGPDSSKNIDFDTDDDSCFTRGIASKTNSNLNEESSNVLHDNCGSLAFSTNNSTLGSDEQTSKQTVFACLECSNSNLSNDNKIQQNRTHRNKSIQTSKHLSNNTPRKTILRKKLHSLRVHTNRSMLSIQKLKAKSVNRLSKAYNKYKTCLNTLTNNVGKVLHGDSLAFVNHQLRMASRPPKGRRYSLDMRLLSLSLYNSGPKAYKYLATIFCLPSKRSLTKWLENMKCTPGFHEETFVGLAEHFKFLKDHEKTCYLLIDEINFKSHLQYDRHNDNVVGYEDLSVFGGRSPKLAKSALVFMLRGMSSN